MANSAIVLLVVAKKKGGGIQTCCLKFSKFSRQHSYLKETLPATWTYGELSKHLISRHFQLSDFLLTNTGENMKVLPSKPVLLHHISELFPPLQSHSEKSGLFFPCGVTLGTRTFICSNYYSF